MSEYVLTLCTERPLGTMDVLLDAVEEELHRLGYQDGEWEATVSGPPELHIGVVMK